jgi:ribonuclease P protein component
MSLQDQDLGKSTDAAGPPEDVAERGAVMLDRVRLRADFLAAASARRQSAGSFMLQARARGDDMAPRVGYTASKKIGNAVARNRAKRRLRAAVHQILRPMARTGWDYVLVARPDVTIARPFADLMADLHRAVLAVHRP